MRFLVLRLVAYAAANEPVTLGRRVEASPASAVYGSETEMNQRRVRVGRQDGVG